MGVITFVVLYYLNIDYERTNRSRAFGGSLKSKFGVFDCSIGKHIVQVKTRLHNIRIII